MRPTWPARRPANSGPRTAVGAAGSLPLPAAHCRRVTTDRHHARPWPAAPPPPASPARGAFANVACCLHRTARPASAQPRRSTGASAAGRRRRGMEEMGLFALLPVGDGLDDHTRQLLDSNVARAAPAPAPAPRPASARERARARAFGSESTNARPPRAPAASSPVLRALDTFAAYPSPHLTMRRILLLAALDSSSAATCSLLSL